VVRTANLIPGQVVPGGGVNIRVQPGGFLSKIVGGIELISTQFTAHRVSACELEIVLPRWQRADDAELYALFPKHATLNHKVRAFVDFAIEVFSTWQINHP
jgi:hypothetical protein